MIRGAVGSAEERPVGNKMRKKSNSRSLAIVLVAAVLLGGCESIRTYDGLVNMGYSSDYAVGYTRVSNPAFGPLAGR